MDVLHRVIDVESICGIRAVEVHLINLLKFRNIEAEYVELCGTRSCKQVRWSPLRSKIKHELFLKAICHYYIVVNLW